MTIIRIIWRAGATIVMIWATALLSARAQDIPDWQLKAGGEASFEVASVKRFKEKIPRLPNMGLADFDNAKPYGGRFFAAFGLAAYITFAYKVAQYEGTDAFAHAPKWVREDPFEIDAKAPGNPTKDQMRLMMQALLVDRFKLAVHFETRQGPVLALMLVTAGEPGPKLIPHSQGPPCPEEYVEMKFGAAPVDPRKEIFPRNCGEAPMRGMPDDTYYVGSRDTTMESSAGAFYSYGFLAGEVDRPIVDQTGLTGRYDWILEYKLDPSHRIFQPQPIAPGLDPQGTPFHDALRKQLGLKLVKTTGPVRTLVIDHIEMPSEN